MSNTFETEVEILYIFFQRTKIQHQYSQVQRLTGVNFWSNFATVINFFKKNGGKKKQFFRFSSHWISDFFSKIARFFVLSSNRLENNLEGCFIYF
jgi:hypothetical protein